MDGKTTRVALCEDDPRYRESLEALFEHTPGFEVRDVFGNPYPLLDRLEHESAGSSPWDLVLMDLELPRMGGIEATTRIKSLRPDMTVVVLTSFEEPATILRAICQGADGYLLKKAPARELVAALSAARRGGASLSGEIAKSVLEVVRRHEQVEGSESPKRLELTEREQDVLRGLSRGQSYDQVGESLGVSGHTVRDHIRRIYKKLHVHTATEAVARAIREGLI